MNSISAATSVRPADEPLGKAEKLASEWRRCMAAGRPGATDSDIEHGFAELAVLIASARLAAPRGAMTDLNAADDTVVPAWVAEAISGGEVMLWMGVPVEDLTVAQMKDALRHLVRNMKERNSGRSI